MHGGGCGFGERRGVSGTVVRPPEGQYGATTRTVHRLGDQPAVLDAQAEGAVSAREVLEPSPDARSRDENGA